jgi:hypothetical protein
MSSIDALLSWLDDALIDAEVALKHERLGILRLASELEECPDPRPAKVS